MPKRTPTGKVRNGEQRNQQMILTGLVTLTASTIIDLQRAVYARAKRLITPGDVQPYEVIGLTFEDVGGAAAETAQRLSSKKNADGTFTIYSEKTDAASSSTSLVWIPSTGTQTVRWTVLVTG